MHQIVELDQDQIDAVSGGTNQNMYSVGVTIAVAGIAMGPTPLGVAFGLGGLFVMAAAIGHAD